MLRIFGKHGLEIRYCRSIGDIRRQNVVDPDRGEDRPVEIVCRAVLLMKLTTVPIQTAACNRGLCVD